MKKITQDNGRKKLRHFYWNLAGLVLDQSPLCPRKKYRKGQEDVAVKFLAL